MLLWSLNKAENKRQLTSKSKWFSDWFWCFNCIATFIFNTYLCLTLTILTKKKKTTEKYVYFVYLVLLFHCLFYSRLIGLYMLAAQFSDMALYAIPHSLLWRLKLKKNNDFFFRSLRIQYLSLSLSGFFSSKCHDSTSRQSCVLFFLCMYLIYN